MEPTRQILVGDCLASLRTLPDRSVQTCVTSPPYWGLRDYGVAGQLGLEPTPDEYVAKMVEVFREVRRVLRDDGTLWLNLGDSYGAGGTGRRDGGISGGLGTQGGNKIGSGSPGYYRQREPSGLKPKDLCGIPWRVAFALQADGWRLRQDIIWAKLNPMPESVTDRCTKSHEYVFLLSKSARYYYDAEAIKEPAVSVGGGACFGKQGHDASGTLAQSRRYKRPAYNLRNKRSVWSVSTKSYPGAHFAVFPPKLIEPCILAGCPVGGVVLDPFTGSGTTAAVAAQHGRNFIGCELNRDYVVLIDERVRDHLAKVDRDRQKEERRQAREDRKIAKGTNTKGAA